MEHRVVQRVIFRLSIDVSVGEEIFPGEEGGEIRGGFQCGERVEHEVVAIALAVEGFVSEAIHDACVFKLRDAFEHVFRSVVDVHGSGGCHVEEVAGELTAGGVHHGEAIGVSDVVWRHYHCDDRVSIVPFSSRGGVGGIGVFVVWFSC